MSQGISVLANRRAHIMYLTRAAGILNPASGCLANYPDRFCSPARLNELKPIFYNVTDVVVVVVCLEVPPAIFCLSLLLCNPLYVLYLFSAEIPLQHPATLL